MPAAIAVELAHSCIPGKTGRYGRGITEVRVTIPNPRKEVASIP
jgi:hypothetical protein